MIVSRRDWRQVTWRNGRGTSAEILARPGLTLNRTPLVDDAPFSAYPGFDRVLVVVSGGLTLDIAGRPHPMTAGDLVAFAGEADVAVRLGSQGRAEVLNLIVDRSMWRAAGMVLDAGDHHATAAGLTLVHARGAVRFGTNGAGLLVEDDTLVCLEPTELEVIRGQAIVLTVRSP